jgi:UPF0755 protein
MVRKAFRAALVVAIVGTGIFAAWLSREINRRPDGPPRKFIFEIERGKGVRWIARLLKQRQVLTREWPFLVEYRLFVSPKGLRAGEYELSLPVGVKDVLHDLLEGKVFLHPLTIPEGLTAREIARFVPSLGFGREQEFLDAFEDPGEVRSLDPKARTCEGYLFPETYHFPKGTPARQITRAMLTEFESVFQDAWRRRGREIGLSLRETVILASLIEKETSLPVERKLVSTVFHNRLKMGMKLDCDPTIIYALKQKNDYEGRLLRKDLTLDSPYNTYLYGGLPPGPICNPGKISLEAALYPAETNNLYFVSRNDGSHVFSKTFAEHQANVRKYQKHNKK